MPVILVPIFVNLQSFVFPLEIQTFDLNGIRDLSIRMIRFDRENFLLKVSYKPEIVLNYFISVFFLSLIEIIVIAYK